MPEHHASTPDPESYDGGGDPGAPWGEAMDELRRSSTFWAATIHPTGRPHVVPVLAVVSDDGLYVAAGPGTQKARNLQRDPRLTITTSGERFDVVLDGAAHPVRDDEALARIAAAYVAKYGWDVEAREGSLHGDGAPTAGPPPYEVYRLAPHRAFGFPTTGDAAPTRWRFRPPATA